MEIKTISTGSIKMRYFSFGNELGQPFVIIPGVALKSVMDSAEFIAAQYSSIAEKFCIYVFDRREDMPENCTIFDMADDMISALEHLGLSGTVVYGVSQGGMIAQAIAIKCPQLVDKLVICSTAPYIPESASEIISEWSACAEKGNVDRLMKSFSENVYSAEFCERCSNVFTEFSRLITDDDLSRFLITVKALENFDIREQLSSINCPLLVIAGDMDRIFGTAPASDIAALTNGQLYVYKGQAHAVYDEEPDVLDRIKSFAL